MRNWDVHKFGGTSVANAERYMGVVDILTQGDLAKESAPRAVVVSAMSKVTDALIELTRLAAARDAQYEAKLEAVLQKHIECVQKILPNDNDRAQKLIDVIRQNVANLAEVLRGVWHARSCSMQIEELVSGHGEVWSAQILHALLCSRGWDAAWLDARDVLVVEPMAHSVSIYWEESEKKCQQWFDAHPQSLVVVTGFVASTPQGVATTLKRNGSDYSASLFGHLLNAKKITIWTDVDGVMSADPRLVPDAVVLDKISYAEASELAYFGAKVVHPDTMGPAVKKQIPVWIKNTFAPQKPGTCISATSSPQPPVKGFATIDRVALINLEGKGMIGVPGVAERLFGALKSVGVSVIMISQASSEQSICFAVSVDAAEIAEKAVRRAFDGEILRGEIEKVVMLKDCSALAMVGDGMAHTPGVAGRLFTALGKCGANVLAIAQGSSERNISVVVPRDAIHRAVRAAHSAFFLSNQTLSVGVIGAGVVGKSFLDQLAARCESLKKERGIDVRLRALTNSRKMVLSETGMTIDKWAPALAEAKDLANITQFAQHVAVSHYPHAAIVDLTASEETTAQYLNWLNQGLTVITANKKAGSGDFGYYQKLQAAARATNRYFLYETTVGAGLPVLHTLRDLLQTGDEIIEIEGVLSGTLSYLFNSYNGQKPFSQVVMEAKASGYTEPDPRDDLSGLDVGRKLVILAREAGVSLDLSAVEIESLVPAHLQKVGVDEFLQKLPELDAPMQQLFQTAHKNKQVLRYVAHLSPDKKATVRLRALPAEHPFARLSGSDNIILFRTRRYKDQPMVIQGPGAGPAVTAAGVFAELLRWADYLGAKR